MKRLFYLLLVLTIVVGSIAPSQGNAKTVISSVDPSYGWQGCTCYHVIVGGTASFPYKVPAADCVNSGHPKPTGCK